MNIVPVDQMDITTRPYFFHHRTQVEINKAIMELFCLLQSFVESDGGEPEVLVSLRALSDILQHKGVIAPMPVDLHDSNENVTTIETTVLQELTRLISLIPQANPTLDSRVQALPGNIEDQTIRRAPAFSASKLPAPVDPPLSTHDTPIEQTLPDENRQGSSMDIPSVSGIRKKVKAWLARPTTQEFRKWVSRNLPSTPLSRPPVLEEHFEIMACEVQNAGEVRPSPPLHGVRVDIERAVKKDLHSENLSLSPPLGDHRRSKSLPAGTPRNAVSTALGRSTTSSSLNGSSTDIRAAQSISHLPRSPPIVVAQPLTASTSIHQTNEPSSPAYDTPSLEATRLSPATNPLSAYPSPVSQHRVPRKPIPHDLDKQGRPQATPPNSAIRTKTTPIKPSPLRHELKFSAASPPLPIMHQILDSPHCGRMKPLPQLPEGPLLGLSVDGVPMPLQDQVSTLPARIEDPSDSSQSRDSSRVGRGRSLSRRSEMHVGNNGHGRTGHRREISESSVVSSVAPSLSNLSDSHSSEDREDGASGFPDRQELEEKVQWLTSPSIKSHSEEREVRVVQETSEKLTSQGDFREIKLMYANNKAFSPEGGALADLAARRKPAIRSQGSGSRSSRSSRKGL